MTNLTPKFLLAFLVAIALNACRTPDQTIAAKAHGAAVDILSHAISLTPNFETKSIAASQEIVLRRVSSAPTTLRFSPNAMTLHRAVLDGKTLEVLTTPSEISIALPQTVGRSLTSRLLLTYDGTPKRGVTFTDTGVFSNYWACDWMFCEQDNFADKASISMTLFLPTSMTSLSNGVLAATAPANGGLQSHIWRGGRPYSAYLFGFAAGKFDVTTQRHNGKTLDFINATGSPQPMARLFGTTPAMVDFFSAKAGLPLPSQGYAQILVTGAQAQEQSTYALIGTDTINPILENPQEDWVIAHELAHQWWGNLVTCNSTSDFWLNEGIVVFMTAAWKQHKHGESAYQRELSVARTRWSAAKDAGWDRPLAFSGEYPSLRLRRAIQYSKGALFMDHLRTVLGEEAFWRGVRAYTRANAGKTVTSADLQQAFERASGKDLRTVFGAWVYGDAANGAVAEGQ